MSEHLDLNGDNVTRMHVVVPKPLYDELAAAMSQSELNDAVVESLKDSLRKRRFRRDLERTAQRREP
jgi:hypothetical protein